MDKLLRESINGTNSHYQQPFLGVSDKDTRESIREKLSKFREQGIYSMVLLWGKSSDDGVHLSKFDDDWWRVLGYISDTCSELGMTYWIQDAAPFPSGAADGWFEKDEYKSQSKRFIAEKHTDIKGPIRDSYIQVNKIINAIRGDLMNAYGKNSILPPKILYAVAVRKIGDSKMFDPSTVIDVTNKISGGILRTDFGPGNWRIFIFIETYSGGRKNYMNLLDEESVRVQINAVHAPHYEHLKEHLGKTWMGFFYDEPEIGNLDGYVFDNLPGKTWNDVNVPLPWNQEMSAMLEERLGAGFVKMLPALWYDFGEQTHIIRHAFMDAATLLIAKNYNGQVYKWCEERGIKYIGHVLEDENSHARLGCGAGNYFRVVEGQHMAGVDLVSTQVWPGCDFEGISWYGAMDGDGEFYHYGLAKLASSAGHIDPKKMGRSVCEFMALYGKRAGTKIRKFIIDHLLVNGVNNLVPGDNGLYNGPIFGKKVNDYTDRLCHILNGGVHVAPAAILYHADAEWSGNFQYFHKPAKELATNQIDYDVIPKDVFISKEYYGTKLEDGLLKVNKENYRALIIPYSQWIPKAIADFIFDAQNAGFPVYFVDDYPEGFCESNEKLPMQILSCRVVPLSMLAQALRSDGIYELSISEHQHYLRYYHYKRYNMDFYLFHNEEPEEAIMTEISIPDARPVRVYDVMENRMFVPKVTVSGNVSHLNLRLGKFETILLVFGEDSDAAPLPLLNGGIELNGTWAISFESLDKGPTPDPITADKLFDIGASGKYPNFYGIVTYSIDFTVNDKLPSYIHLGKLSECAEVYINNQYLGAAVAEPYRFDLAGSTVKGNNRLAVVIHVNKARSIAVSGMDEHDSYALMGVDCSTYTSLELSGLLGPVTLLE